jgi:protein TonB
MANVASRVPVQYSALARQARIQDHVILRVIIGTDGAVRDVKVVSGHPLLRQGALDAVRQWRYKPTMLNGAPVEVETDVDVNFALDQ